MRKSLENFTSKLRNGSNLQLQGGYKVLANLRGGIKATNPMSCDNHICSGLANTDYCTNSTDCSNSTNGSNCTNSAVACYF